MRGMCGKQLRVRVDKTMTKTGTLEVPQRVRKTVEPCPQ